MRRLWWAVGVSLWLASASLSVASSAVDGAVVTAGAGQSIPTGAATPLVFTVEVTDSGSYWTAGSPSVVTIPRAAWCTATGTARLELSGSQSGWLALRVDGGWPPFAETGGPPSASLGQWVGNVAVGWLAAAGAQVTLEAFQTTGVGRSVTWARLSVTCDADAAGSGGEPCPTGPAGGCEVEVIAFADQALDYVKLGLFALVVVGGFLLLMLAWIAVQGLRR